jgi:hypothetical protein
VLGSARRRRRSWTSLAFADVARDRDRGRRFTGQVDPLEEDFGGDRRRALAQEVQRYRARLRATLPTDRMIRGSASPALLDEIDESMPREFVRRPAQERTRTVIDALDDVGRRFEDEDRLRDRVEDLPEPVGGLEGARVLDGGACPRARSIAKATSRASK